MIFRICQICWVLGFGALVLSCATDREERFPTAQSLDRTRGGSELSLATLELGRKVYTTKCTECHVVRAIGGYSAERWRHYVGVMSPRAHLSVEEQAAVESYLLTARAALPQARR